MPNDRTIPPAELPSSRTLLRSTLTAAVVAIAILFTIVLPAEYGVDPTGIGQLLGLKRMGEIKVALAREAAADAAADSAAPASSAPATPAPVSPALAAAAVDSQTPVRDSTANSHETVVTIAPGQAREIKLAMRKGARATFSWSTDRGVVNFDTHGDSLNAPKSYHNYSKGTAKPSDEGVVVAAFDGMHGWFWRNRTKDTVTITLRTRGEYQELKRLN